MGFFQKTLDTRKLLRTLSKRPADPEWKSKFFGALTQYDLSPVMQNVYLQILRTEEINVSELDFSKISEDDLDDLLSVLNDNPTHDLITLSETFRQFAPSATIDRVFI